jgi:hypothetical protein
MEDKWLVPLRALQYTIGTEGGFQCVKGGGTLWGPGYLIGPSFAGQICQWGCYGCVARYDFTIVAREAKERPDTSLRSRPFKALD